MTNSIWHNNPAQLPLLKNQQLDTFFNWLRFSGSTTAKLQYEYNLQLNVTIISEGWQKNNLAISQLYCCDCNEQVFVRKTILSVANKPWMIATIVVIAKKNNSSIIAINKLGNSPIGKIIFADPAIQRECMLFKQNTIDEAHPNCITRAATLTWKNNKVLLNETFLPHHITANI